MVEQKDNELQPGQLVPDFTLPSSTGADISLSDYKGRPVVLYFYPKDQTPACTQEACDFRDRAEYYERHGAVLLGISGDDLKSHGRFAAKHELPFPLLSDVDHEVCRLFGVWQLKKMYGREYEGIVRSTFLIDAEGKLARAWRKVKVKNHAEEVLEAVKQLPGAGAGE
ncbi:thioredoxin-dependent thiol peroxidase [Paenibacillus physcomitrellae]|uniref:thioredoxin-dependent peroxiredoxin n=1 Tax=Paenibacillus physcomitrellae TaxID=1619311 RepID=A0ABQ1GT60_9BACL|nr:thioredoxin-dependent thiol peroxidase [Paenibacillus physcomitrellae]GGA49901.1 peroxiredoxin [Paenibacillus physcomitrellae]